MCRCLQHPSRLLLPTYCLTVCIYPNDVFFKFLLIVAWNFSASQFLLFVNPFAHTEWTNPTSTSPPYNADAATAASTPREACTKKFTERSMSLIYETATNIPVPLLKTMGAVGNLTNRHE